MAFVLVALYFAALALLALFSFVQLLYLESLRLRARDFPALGFFKERVQPALNLETDHAALVFTLYKHSLLVAIGVLALLINQDSATDWLDIVQGIVTALVSMAIFSYLMPQMAYRRAEGKFLLPLAPFLKFSALLMRPFSALLSFAETIAEISKPSENLEEGASPQEEIDALIAAGEEEGLIEEGDAKLIQSVVAFGDKRVREVMTPRPNIVAIESSKTMEELRRLVIHEQFSRIPIFEDDLDHITGFVHVRDMFEVEYEKRPQLFARDLQRTIAFVPETKLVTDLLKEMQQAGNHMAIVVDEYGNTAGLATMEDLVEEVFGEIRDEHEPGHDVHDEGEGSYVVAGSYDVDHLKDLIGYAPNENLEATTVGGLATEWFGRVPKSGESLERNGVYLEVLASDERRVAQVRLRKAQQGEQDHAEEESAARADRD